MARTPLLSDVERLASELSAEDPVPGTTTRRELLRRAGAAGVLVAAGSLAPGSRILSSASAAATPRVVIIGGGLAGLTAAHRLRQAGIIAQVHEASTRLGGRCWTIRGAFAEGQIAEHGGELIDTGHLEIRHLIQELGLDTDNLLRAQANGTEDQYFFDGQPYSYAEATRDMKAIWQQVKSDVQAASYPTLYTSSTERGRELDLMSIAEWIDTYVPGGRGSRLGQLLDVAYNIEYGAETSDQSSLNMLYLLGYSGQGNLRIFGPSNEKFHVRGGNDLIVQRLATRLSGQVTLGSELVAIRRTRDGTYVLSLQQGSNVASVTADHVVLALPFSILRTSVDYSKAGFSAVKRRAIEELGMGANAKLNVQFSDRWWNELGCNGATYADTGYQATWDVTRAQPGRSGILVDYTGGDVAVAIGGAGAETRAQTFLTQLEPVLPGISSRWNGRATLDHWPTYPWTLGAYSYWKVGQYQSIAGAEGERSGTCHFAGEHTSIDFQGYLNGAVESGERAVAEILSDLK